MYFFFITFSNGWEVILSELFFASLFEIYLTALKI